MKKYSLAKTTASEAAAKIERKARTSESFRPGGGDDAEERVFEAKKSAESLLREPMVGEMRAVTSSDELLLGTAPTHLRIRSAESSVLEGQEN